MRIVQKRQYQKLFSQLFVFFIKNEPRLWQDTGGVNCYYRVILPVSTAGATAGIAFLSIAGAATGAASRIAFMPTS